MDGLLSWYALGAGALAAASLPRLVRRVALSRAKHRSLAGHPRIALRLARLLPAYGLAGDAYFGADGAPAALVERRRQALARMSESWRTRFARTLDLTSQVREGLSDLQFTGRYRVPFPFRELTAGQLPVGAFVASSSGVTVTDLDGNVFHDLTGSYGVNVLGHDFYKSCIAEAAARAGPLGAVLGAYHPCVADNVRRLREISGLDEVSFHMSGTEAVMQAVRLARYHTRRSHVVRFCGAYHGWWEDVQPGVGNPLPSRRTHTLRDMDERTLQVLRTRRDIACVLVNPVQALHPNLPAPGDGSLLAQRDAARFDRAAYTQWLQRLREVCTERGIVLILDEVFVGFRLDPGGAQANFGVRADLVTYGKTLGGGLPVGVVCGRRELMRRYRDGRPADICFARGTFNAHPYVMAAMQVFLERLDTPAVRERYHDLDTRWDARAQDLNERLAAAGLPVRVANLSTIWTVKFIAASRYHWMLQYYLRDRGLALSWVGTGRLLFSLDTSEADFRAIADRFVAAAQAMRDDGWWWSDPSLSRGSIRRRMLRETFAGLRGSRPD